VKKTLAEHLREASDLFDSGEVVRAGQIWSAILKRDPSNNDAKSGLLKVRDVLLMGAGKDASTRKPIVETPSASDQTRSAVISEIPSMAGSQPLTPPVAGEDIERHLREGCSLYDAGERREALKAWEKVLAIDPEHSQALSYVRGVRKELGLTMSDSARQTPDTSSADEPLQTPISPRQPQSSESLEEVGLLIKRGVQLYETGMFEDALSAWESALALDPDNNLAKGYLMMVQKDLETRPTAALQSPPDEPVQGSFEPEPVKVVEEAVQPQTSIESAPKPAKDQPSPLSAQPFAAQIPSTIIKETEMKRKGLRLNKKNPKISLPSWLTNPIFSRIAVVTVLLLIAGTVWIRSVKKDSLLRATQAAIRDEAIKSVKPAHVVNLILAPVELKSQAILALHDNPLRAYLLAQEIIDRDPLDTTAARLLDQAKQAMIALPPPRTSGRDFNRLMAAGNLEDAEALLEARLRQTPDDMRARENLARVNLLIARTLIKQGRWDRVRPRLLMGAALFPKDPTWQARLKLLDNLQSIPKDEQRHWIELLG